ncbi:MAG: hypothetical protein AAGD22_01500 [Verrucomicrobiota bacterium]
MAAVFFWGALEEATAFLAAVFFFAVRALFFGVALTGDLDFFFAAAARELRVVFVLPRGEELGLARDAGFFDEAFLVAISALRRERVGCLSLSTNRAWEGTAQYH